MFLTKKVLRKVLSLYFDFLVGSECKCLSQEPIQKRLPNSCFEKCLNLPVTRQWRRFNRFIFLKKYNWIRQNAKILLKLVEILHFYITWVILVILVLSNIEQVTVCWDTKWSANATESKYVLRFHWLN